MSNWNDERIERNRAHSYLERIRADLDADIYNFRDRLAFWKQVSAYGEFGLDYANTGDLGAATQWDLLLAYFQASQLAEFYTTRSTYDELRSSGALGLISGLELRDQHIAGSRKLPAVSEFERKKSRGTPACTNLPSCPWSSFR